MRNTKHWKEEVFLMLNNGYHVADDLKDICESFANKIFIQLNHDEPKIYTLIIYRECNKVKCSVIETENEDYDRPYFKEPIYTCEIGFLIDEATKENYKKMGFHISVCNNNFGNMVDDFFFNDYIDNYKYLDYFRNIKSDILPRLINSESFPVLKSPLLPVPKFDTTNFNIMVNCFKTRTSISKAYLILSEYMQNVMGIIRRKNSNKIYQVDLESNGYKSVTIDDMVMEISSKINQPISDTDVRRSLEFIQSRLIPQYNIVRFGNCIYDMNKMEVTTQIDPLFTLIETDYDYNPDAESTLIKGFLETSLEKDTPEATKNAVKGVKEFIGYLFTSGNRLNILPIITGTAGGGKSTFTNILIGIFGQQKVADLKLQELTKNTHATSALRNKHLNIVQDSDDSTITNNSIIKQLTGNDSIDVNPKYQDPYTIPNNEVPKTIVVCNNPPKFKNLEKALIQRFMIIEFNVQFRGTSKENPTLLKDILSNEEEIEWLIYESLSAYKEMVESGRDFTLRQSGDDTKKLFIKHQNSISYYLSQVIKEHNPKNNSKVKYVDTNDLNRIILQLAEDEGVDIETNKDGIISPKDLVQAIRDEFDLDSKYNTKTHAGRRYYPDLIVTDKYLETKSKLESQGKE